MIQGSAMGTVEMTRRIHQYTGKADPELLALGSRLLHAEEQEHPADEAVPLSSALARHKKREADGSAPRFR